MLLHKRNVDFCDSLYIGQDDHGHDLKIRIDKLTVVSCFISKTEKKKTYFNLEIMRYKKYKKYRVQFVHSKSRKPYRRALLIRSINKNSPVLLRIDYSPINVNTGGIRLDVRPQHLTSEEIVHLLSWINNRLGKEFYVLLARAWITQVDVALDIYDCQLDDYIWGLERSGKTAYYDTINGLPGVRIGSPRSLLHILFYGKVDAHRCKKLGLKRKSKFIDINLDEYQHFLRVEARFRPNAKPKGKSLNPLMLDCLSDMSNPFERLQVFSKELETALLRQGLLSEIPREPSTAALKHSYLQETTKLRVPRKLDSIISTHSIVLFDKKSIWQHWPACIMKIQRALLGYAT